MTQLFTLLKISDGLAIRFGADGLGRMFLCLDTVMWILVGIYAFKYKEHMKHTKRFFAFYLLTYLMLAALSMAANYLTMYLCFEFMTLLSMPMVLQDGTPESIAAARKYLMYSIFGATLGLLGFFFSAHYGAGTVFTPGGLLDPAKVAGNESKLLVVAFLSIAGFSAKAGMFPLHAWLPTAHPVAPAPASAVLSGVITKAGVLCILRVMYQVYGASFLAGTWVQKALIVLSLITVFMGSMMAYGEDLLKRRLAYSTVSQVSYVLFGVFTLHPVALLGALLHVIYHSIIKDGLFLGAGAVIFTNHKEYVSQLHYGLFPRPHRHSALRGIPQQMVSGVGVPFRRASRSVLAGSCGAAAVRAADGGLPAAHLDPRLLPGGRGEGSGRQGSAFPDALPHARSGFGRHRVRRLRAAPGGRAAAHCGGYVLNDRFWYPHRDPGAHPRRSARASAGF